MSRKILAFGASNSNNSINKKLATYTAKQIDGAVITVLDLNNFEMPIYSIDREKESGIPDFAVQFKNHIKPQMVLLSLLQNIMVLLQRHSTNFSMPSFHKNFSKEKGILDEALSEEFHSQLELFSTSWIEK